MSSPSDPKLAALLLSVRADYARSLPRKIADMRAFIARGHWVDARRAAHNLRGTSAVHGFRALGELGARAEELLRARDGAPEATQREQLERLLDDLAAEAERARAELA